MTDYPPGLTLRPIVAWPGAETAMRIRAPFQADWSRTLDLLGRELLHLGGGRRPDAVLQIAMREQDFRLDGMPRANAKPTHPGVILSVESTNGPLSFPCDRFDDWRDNLRAIALALEALRQVKRYGIVQNDEQYRGWRAIEPAAQAPHEAERVLRLAARMTDAKEHPLTAVVRAARANAHPDRNSGDRSGYDAVDAAIQVLEKAGRP